MNRTFRAVSLICFLLGTSSGVEAREKEPPPFAFTWCASQPYPYNTLTFDGVYQGNLLSNLSLECSLSPYWSLTAAYGNDVLAWKNNTWIEDPVSQMAVSNVYLNTWHYLGGVKFFPWGEFIHDNYWRLAPYFTLEGGKLDLGAMGFSDPLRSISDGFIYYSVNAPVVGWGLGLEVGTPGEEEESEALRFFSRNVRFFLGLKYFLAFTPYNLQYLPLQFGVKIKFP